MEAQILSNVTPFVLNVVKKETKYHQLVYASQLYGTFFAVGASLNIKDSKLVSMDLTLINYKGLYNLGLTDLTKISFSDDGKNAVLTLHLTAFGGIHGHGKNFPLKCGNHDLQKLETMKVTRVLHSFSNRSSITEHLADSCFDNEFFDRDGSVIVERTRMDDILEDKKNELFGPMADVSGVCRMSNVRFVG